MGQHQGRSPGLGDDVGHREGFASPRRTEQGLIALATIHPLHQLGDRRGLVPFRGIGRREIEGGHEWASLNAGWSG